MIMMSNKREGKYFQNGSSLFFSEKMAGSDCQGVEACGAGLFLSRWRIFFFFFWEHRERWSRWAGLVQIGRQSPRQKKADTTLGYSLMGPYEVPFYTQDEIFIFIFKFLNLKKKKTDREERTRVADFFKFFPKNSIIF